MIKQPKKIEYIKSPYRVKGLFKLAFLSFIVLTFTNVYAGTILRYTVTDANSEQEDKRSAYVSNGMVRVINTAGRIEPEAIFDSKKNTLILLDHQRKSFININEKELTAMAGQIKGLIDSVMSELPFKNPLLPQPDEKSVKHSGIQKRVAGISCDLYEIFIDQVKESEVCIAKLNRLNIPQNDYNTLEQLYKTGDRLAKTARNTIGQSLGSIPEFGTGNIDGLPIYLLADTDGLKLKLILTTITQESVSEDYFKIPPGYEEQSLPSLM